MTEAEAAKAIDAVSADIIPLDDWQKVVLLGYLTGWSPVTISRARRNGASTNNARILQALDRIEEARAHGLA